MGTLSDIVNSWNGSVEVDGRIWDDSVEAHTGLLCARCIKLCANSGSSSERNFERSNDTPQYLITVKSYMTKKATPSFDFMAKWNNNNPMPLITMVGEVEKETPGMVYMKLHGDIVSQITTSCMCCGKAITNPVSQYFGMGPVCGNHSYVNPFESDEELKEAVKRYRTEYLNKITWEGWIIKSAIITKQLIS